jgi:predicted ArsR family transcriptional regulator
LQSTRWQILELIKRLGSLSLDELSKQTGLALGSVRSHLALLERDHLVRSYEVRGRIGRPHLVYKLTATGHDKFPTTYQNVAQRVLDAMMVLDGPEKLRQVFEVVGQRWAADRCLRVRGSTLFERVRDIAAIREEEGALPEVEQTDKGYVMHQHNCPAFHVASKHPLVCHAELEYIRQLVGSPVERVNSIVSGAATCSYLFREEDPAVADSVQSGPVRVICPEHWIDALPSIS